MIRSFNHRGLKELFETGRSRRVRTKLQRRAIRRLDTLDSASELAALKYSRLRFSQASRQTYPLFDSYSWAFLYNVRVGRRRQREPTHPGAILREDVIPKMGISVSEFARRIGVSRQTLHKILAETDSITPNTALRIGKLIPALRLRAAQAQHKHSTSTAGGRIPPL